MVAQYDVNVKALIAYLKQLKVKVNGGMVNETLQNHPDWPSLLCIGDSLHKWNVPNAAGKMDPTAIAQLPTPFLAYANDRENPLSVITEVTNSSIRSYSKNYNNPLNESQESFLKNWTGVYLIAEVTVHSGEKDFEVNKRKEIVSSLIPVSLVVLLVTLSVVFIYNSIQQNSLAISSTGIYLQYIVSLIGMAVASMLLWYEVDKNNPVLKKVCTGITKGDCNAILTGSHAKVFSWLSWSEVGFFYFTGGLLLLLFAGIHLTNAIIVLAWLNILALPYSVFSVYYQWKIAKQWCVLCLAVQALFVLGAINVFVNHLLTTPLALPVTFLINALLFYLLPVLTWYTVKPAILRLQAAKNTRREYLRIKFNTEIFDTLLKKQKQLTVAADGLGIKLGNPTAANTLIKVCNPYCGPCAKAHPAIEKLLEENSNLKVQIIFTTPNLPEEKAYKPVNHLLAIQAQSNDEQVIKQALDDWYLSDKKEYDVFAAKYVMNGELTKQGEKIEAMDNWCKSMNIHVTPTIFINGYQLPDAYNIEDLQYFLLE